MKNDKNKVDKRKVDKRKIVKAHPGVSFLTPIKIMEKEHSIEVGGFTCDGGFYLREGYKLVKRKDKNIMGEEITYFNFVKDPKKKGKYEKELLKQARERKGWKEKRKKELKKELDGL